MRYKGSCHCGRVAFEVEGEIGPVIFNKHLPTCGIDPYAVGKDPKGNDMAAINVRCLEGVDLAKLTVKPFDGRSL